MILLNPWWLGLLVLAGVIFWLHRRRRFQKVQAVPSLLLWQRLQQEQPPLPPLQWPPLSLALLLQLLVLLGVVLALTQPWTSWGQSTAQHTVFLLDASLSMQTREGGQTRFALAQQRLVQRLGATRQGRISLMVVGPNPYLALARLEPIQAARFEPTDLKASDGQAPWGQALELLGGVVRSDEQTQLVVLTDPQGWGQLQPLLAAQWTVDPVVLGQPHDNLGLYRVTSVASQTKRGLWRLEGHVGNYTQQPQEVRVVLNFIDASGQRTEVGQSDLRIARGAGSFFRFEVQPTAAGIYEVALPSDALEADNRAYIRLPLAQTARLLYLGTGNPPLERALRALPNVEVFGAVELPADSASYDWVVVDRLSLPRHPQTHTVWLASRPTGIPPADGSSLTAADPTLWDTRHAVSRQLDWAQLTVNEAIRLPLLPGATSLVQAAQTPLIQVRTTQWGREVAVAFALAQSNWAGLRSFPLFWSNLLSYALAPVQSTYCQVGQTCLLDPRLLFAGARLVDPAGDQVPLAVAFTPDQPAWLPPLLEEAFQPERAGAYWLDLEGVRYPVAVSGFFPDESNLLLEGTSAQTPTSITRNWLPAWTWWKVLLLLTLMVMLFEAFWVGRAEGWLVWHGVPGPLTRRRRLILGLQGLAAVLLILALLGGSLPWPSWGVGRVVVAQEPTQYADPRGERADQIIAQTRNEQPAAGQVWLTSPPQWAAAAGGPAAPLPAQPVAGLGSASLAAGLDLASAMIPPNQSGRLLVLADGTSPRSPGLGAALGRLVERGIAVDVLPLGGVPVGEVLVETVEAPARVRTGDTFVLTAVVFAEQAGSATLRVWRENQLWANQAIELQAGSNRLEATLREQKVGNVRYALEVQMPGDTYTQNNRYQLSVPVASGGKVALFTAQPQAASNLVRALEVQGLRPVVRAPQQLPETAEGWAEYEVAYLINLPISQISLAAQKALENWVRQRGGGLVIVGGDRSFGPGGYYRTALENLSPLSSRVPREAPKVAMLFVIDKSGSMNQPAGEARRIDIVKEGTLEALRTLHPDSLAGVVAFESQAQIAVPMQPVTDRQGFADRLSGIQPGGGTSIYPALVTALEALQNIDAMARHIVLMTDGLSTPGDFDAIVDQIVAQGITLSTVAVGEGARVDLMQRIAQRGGGVAHFTSDWTQLPAILAQEALLQSKSPVKTQRFDPAWKDTAAIWLTGLPDQLPALGGYVQTTAKPEATLHLVGPDNDPLLASWNLGLGRVVAFASQASGPWSAEWLTWSGYPRLWGQLSRYLLGGSSPAGLSAELVPDGARLQLRVTAATPEGLPQEALELQARLGSDPPINLWEAAPGEYQAVLPRPAVAQSEWAVEVVSPLLRLQARPFSLTESQPVLPEAAGGLWVEPYPQRFAFTGTGAQEVLSLAPATGGAVLTPDLADGGGRQLRWSTQPLWPITAVLALLVFLAAVAARYLPVRRAARTGTRTADR
jgi:Mg-chelatase subunit ChlD